MQRRHFLWTPPALALGAGVASAITSASAVAAPSILTSQTKILPRKGKGPRIVICGGGWAGGVCALSPLG